jgi:peptidoglycan/LPS O-acetylase OafA/YrhL
MEKSDRYFSGSLESVRGIAAVLVVIHHTAEIFSVKPSPADFFLRMLGNGPGGVFIFFILSGYVLSLSIERALQDVGERSLTNILLIFYIKRAFRLIPVLVCSILIVYVVKSADLLPNDAGFSEFEYAFLGEPVTLWRLVKNLLLVSFHISGVTWTLQVELIWSLLLPFLVLFDRRATRYQRMGLYAVFIMFQLALPYHWFLHFAAAFYLGIRLTHSIPPRAPSLVLAVGLVVAFVLPKVYDDLRYPPDKGLDLAYLIGTGLVLWCVIHARAGILFFILESRLARFVGKLSYSLYLIQIPAIVLSIVVCTSLIGVNLGVAGNIFLAILSPVLALPLAWLLYVAVEKPSLQIARIVVRNEKVIGENCQLWLSSIREGRLFR